MRSTAVLEPITKTKTNIIRLHIFGQIRIQIIFRFFHVDRMQKYYLGSSFRPNTNIICGPLLFEYKYYLFEYEYWNYLNNTEYEYRWYWKSTNIKTEHIYFQLLVKYIWNGYAIQFASFILIRIWMIFKFSKSSKYKY